MIGLILKSLCYSVLTPGMTDGASTVLFLVFMLKIDSNMENKIISNKYKISDMDQTIILIIAIYITYLLEWCTTIINDRPVLF